MAVDRNGEGQTSPHADAALFQHMMAALSAGVYILDDKSHIIWVNPRAETLLVRSAADMIGHDSHDLLHRGPGGGTSPRHGCRLLGAFLSGTTAHSDEWFERGDGAVIHVACLGVPYRTQDGTNGGAVIFYEHPPREAPAAESSDAAAELSDVIGRLTLVAEITTVLTSTLDSHETLRRLVRLLVPQLGDWAVVDLLGESGEVQRVAVVHHHHGAYVNAEEFEGSMPPVSETENMPLARVLRGVPPVIVSPADYEGSLDTGIAVQQRDLIRATGIRSAVIAPLHGLGGVVLGALTVGRAEQPQPYGPAELTLVDDIARRAGLAVDNARLYEQQRRAQGRLELLYEAGMRIGTTLDVRRTAEQLTQVVVPRFADIATVELLDPVPRGDEPTGKRTQLRRTAVSSGLTGQPLYPVGELISFAPSTPHTSAVEHGHAVLERDLEAAHGWRAWDPQQAEKILACGLHSLIAVPLQARGVMLGLATFWRARKEPFAEEDLSLVEELAARAAVCIDNARRYTREHAMAVTLQRRLLPLGLPEQDALEVAYRYLPAQAGVGGDWFDVIPLPGTRVALVVGDVVGHGLHAAATMGRLRTAVHNFSALDLPPDELLAHLDDLVTRVDQEQTGTDEGAGTGVTGATCLYAIYDPVCGRCSMARAGHPGPALVRPDGTVSLPDIPGSPPLGLCGSLPIEVTELQLAQGSHLVLFTDGLVEDRHHDFDAGLMLLLDTLNGTATQTPEETCQTVFNTMVPDRPRDDVALLVARTRMLDPAQVADWDVPSDPAAVAPVRGECGRQLQVWGLEDIQFTAELILSELITNAIRYGTQPIHVRLLRDRNLICEVSDGSSTSPHLRRAETTDEGGRGLFLVAQFAQGWGTRYTPHGKIIWTEQPLHAGAAEPIEQPNGILLDQWSDEAF
ncbi:SpoIIE family protein phosphatase [Streptomyces sp. NPDC000994]